MNFQGELTSGQWEEQTEDINFATVNFVITEHRLKQDGQTEGGGVEEQEEGGLVERLLRSLFPMIRFCSFFVY